MPGRQNTTVALTLVSKHGSETFPNYQGPVPRVGEYVNFYKKMHDGALYGGFVKRVTHRIEFHQQNDQSTYSTDDVTVHLKGKKLRWIL